MGWKVSKLLKLFLEDLGVDNQTLSIDTCAWLSLWEQQPDCWCCLQAVSCMLDNVALWLCNSCTWCDLQDNMVWAGLWEPLDRQDTPPLTPGHWVLQILLQHLKIRYEIWKYYVLWDTEIPCVVELPFLVLVCSSTEPSICVCKFFWNLKSMENCQSRKFETLLLPLQDLLVRWKTILNIS